MFMSVFVFQNAIANASSLAEVERLKGMLQAGQIPGRDLRQGQCCPNSIPQLDNMYSGVGTKMHTEVVILPAK